MALLPHVQVTPCGQINDALSTKVKDKLNLFLDALNGSRGQQQRIIAEEGLSMIELLLRKNHDYGSSVFKPPVLCPDLPTISAIEVRMSDKIARINNLKSCEAEVASESIDETYNDLGGYVLLRKAVLRYEKEPRHEVRTNS